MTTPPLKEGMVRKGGINPYPSRITERPAPPPPMYPAYSRTMQPSQCRVEPPPMRSEWHPMHPMDFWIVIILAMIAPVACIVISLWEVL